MSTSCLLQLLSGSDTSFSNWLPTPFGVEIMRSLYPRVIVGYNAAQIAFESAWKANSSRTTLPEKPPGRVRIGGQRDDAAAVGQIKLQLLITVFADLKVSFDHVKGVAGSFSVHLHFVHQLCGIAVLL